MRALKLALTPRTAFATPLIGDTLFGQLCWAIRHGWGEARLAALLEGYTAGRPFLVVGDAFPAGHLPLPALPAAFWAGRSDDPKERKKRKRIAWMPADILASPLETWQAQANERRPAPTDFCSRPQPRNSLNRLTQATGKGDGFSPYTVRQHWFAAGAERDLHLRLDESRMTQDELAAALAHVGAAGFGKDANVGLGKFDCGTLEDCPLPGHAGPDAWLTLAPCAPQGLAWGASRCFYRPFTRYGRHGDQAARLASPFKNPLLLAAAGALLAPAGTE
ncbi:MAG: CRISPR-associated protein Csm7, partial [Candidatus Desulfobacillus denitrificans]